TCPTRALSLHISCSTICACAGSTSVGMKVDRLLLSGKMIRNRLKLQQHPNAVIRTKVDGIVQDDSVLNTVVIFVVAYIMLILIGTIVNTMFGQDLMTGFSASVACTSNVGPGFGGVGSMNNYSDFPSVLKFNGALLMLLGRLEIFGFIQLFFIRYWK
ncbi:MAG: TrkH family potassium uptake protein, partial [Alistipes sp.]|nr:TrkH family potassium uptake protein [Alistipes sp.]